MMRACGDIDVDDLLAVINQWGPCTPRVICTADINADGAVDVDDLLSIITNWGLNCATGTISGEGMPQTIDDCFDICDIYSGQAWQSCVAKCAQGVCESNPSECD